MRFACPHDSVASEETVEIFKYFTVAATFNKIFQHVSAAISFHIFCLVTETVLANEVCICFKIFSKQSFIWNFRSRTFRSAVSCLSN